jgi:hypothetical protein
MKLRTLWAALTMLFACPITRTGLDELKATLDQAQRAAEKASKHAQAYFENYHIEYDAALAIAGNVEAALSEASVAYNIALNLQAQRNAQMINNCTVLDVLRHKKDVTNRVLTMMQVQDITATLTWENGHERDLFGVVETHNDGTVTFVGKPTHEDTIN